MTENELRSKVVAIMQSWVGIKAGTPEHKEIIDTYNQIKPLPRGHKLTYTEPWCAGTVSASGSKAGLLEIMPAECSCNNLIKLYKAIGRWAEDDTYVPKPGDLVIYDWQDGKDYSTTDNQGKADHVGMTEKVENGIIVVIEGNCGNQVARRSLKINGRYIRGFCCPDFAGYAEILTEKEDEDMDVNQFRKLYQQMRQEDQDNDSGSWSEDAREWAVSSGLVQGNGLTSSGEPNYMWEDVMSREQLVTVLYRFFRWLTDQIRSIVQRG